MNVQVSVIIPTYNCAAYLGKAIDSVKKQTCKDVEIIIYDDASTDSTGETLNRFDSDESVTIIRGLENHGPGYGRNQAMMAASGKWIALLDADDWFAPDRLDYLLSIAEKENLDVIGDAYYMVEDGQEQPYATRFSHIYKENKEWSLITAGEFVFQDLGSIKPVFRRSFLLKNNIMYEEDTNYGEDFLFYFACLIKNARFGFCSTPCYFRRQRSGSLTTDKLKTLVILSERLERLMDSLQATADNSLKNALGKRINIVRYALVTQRFIHMVKNRNYIKAISCFMVDAVLGWKFLRYAVFRRNNGIVFIKGGHA